jgi:hypothetical protein
VGLVYSQQTAWLAGGERIRERVGDPSLGWYQALVESRIPFEMVHDRLLDASHLAALRTLILPNVEALRARHGPGHPLLRRPEDVPRVIHGAWQLEVQANRPFPNPPVTLIRSYPDLPMEKVYVRQPRTDVPQILPREAGAGRVVYSPWDIDRAVPTILAHEVAIDL